MNEIIEVIKLVKKASKNFENTALADLAKVPKNSFQVLVSCIISLRTKDEVTAAASKRLFDVAPKTMEDLLRFKGVGRKTANIVLVYGHGKRFHIPVDTHVHRIPNRLGWIDTKNPEQTEKELERIIPRRYWGDFNDLFVSFGQNICKPVSPKCGVCPVSKYCRYYRTEYKKNV